MENYFIKMTQHQLIIEYCKEFGSILPAKQHGFAYKDGFLGSETSKRCRELRKSGVLRSEREGKFERFFLIGVSYNGNTTDSKSMNRGSIPLTPAICCNSFKIFGEHALNCPSLKKVESKINQLQIWKN